MYPCQYEGVVRSILVITSTFYLKDHGFSFHCGHFIFMHVQCWGIFQGNPVSTPAGKVDSVALIKPSMTIVAVLCNPVNNSKGVYPWEP